jgi:hypothetical protein
MVRHYHTFVKSIPGEHVPGQRSANADSRLVRQFYFFFSSSSVAFACGTDRKIASSKEQG